MADDTDKFVSLSVVPWWAVWKHRERSQAIRDLVAEVERLRREASQREAVLARTVGVFGRLLPED